MSGSWENELLPLLASSDTTAGVCSAFCASSVSLSFCRYFSNVARVACASSSSTTSTEDTSSSAWSIQQIATRRMLLSKFTEL